MRAIGKIVKSNSHIDYICQVYRPGEMTPPPAPDDYAFGQFVAIRLEMGGTAAGELIGVVYNTQLVNPDFGTLGPRLSSRGDLEIFSPDYLAETATLVGLLAVGWTDAAGRYQGVPPLATDVNAAVRALDEDEFRAFHQTAAGALSLRYVPMLLAQESPLVPPLLLTVLDRLGDLFPAEQGRLAVMRNNLAWRRIVAPAG